MSVQNDLTTFEQTKEDLEKRLSEISPTLISLYVQRGLLIPKIKKLSIRTSSLARTLLQKAQEELEKVDQEIVQVEIVQNEVRKKLDEVNQKILERDNDPSLYIKEQSSRMISTFLEYIESHLEEIGAEIKKSYRIMEVTQFHHGCNIPTGNIGLYDESNKCFIVTSKNFHFKQILYILIHGEYDALICHKSDWYKIYHDNFISYLAKTLQENYIFDEVFELTIKGSYFTLELV